MSDDWSDATDAADEPWTAAEREALEAWRIADAPADLGARALAKAHATGAADRGSAVDDAGSSVNTAGTAPSPRTFTRLVGLAAAVATAAVFAWASLAPLAVRPARGRVQAERRTTVVIGERGVAVLEPATILSFAVNARGAADVEQTSGNAFYRVERGGPFAVHTPVGDVRATGTSFRVEVVDMKSMSAGVVGAGLGAALATAVVVTVYEGRVVTAAEGRELAVGAGESARLAAGRGPEPTDAAEVARGGGAEVVRDGRALAALPGGLTVPQLYEAHAKLRARAADLEREVAQLRAKAGSAAEGGRDVKTYDLDPEELKQMAANCELRWDMQPMRGKAETLSPGDVDRLHLSESEREVVNRVLAQSGARIVGELAKIYVEVTGDSATGSLSPMSMFEEIVDKAPEHEMPLIYQRLARERAGLQAPPADLSATSPWERVLRLMTTAGDGLEGSLAAELGPELAHRIRDLHGGFGSKSRSRMGCPKEQQGSDGR